MTIYVDRTRHWPQAPKPGAERYFGNGKPSCHMTTDGSIEELLAFAAKLGLQRSWIQREPRLQDWHFDLIPAKRKLACKLGAVERDPFDHVEDEGPPPVQGQLFKEIGGS